MTETRTIKTDLLARVEGEGAMFLRIRDGRVDDVRLRIYEPPRFFEAFLRGRGYREPVDITARICGICPIAYQMSACAAIEDACGVEVAGAIRALRRLIYCGEWIESHALHVFMLHAPDILGYDSAIEMARDHRGIVEQGAARSRRPATRSSAWSAAARSTRSTCASAASTARRARASCARWSSRSSGRASSRSRRCASPAASRCPTSSPSTSTSRSRRRTRYPLEGGRLVSTGGLDIAPGRVRGALRGAARRALDRAALAAARARRLPVRPARALRAELGEAVAAGARGGRRGRARRRLPQPVPQHRRAQRRDPLRARRGAAADRRLRGARRALRRGRAARRHRLRLDRGAARAVLAPLSARRRTARSSRPRSSRRPRRTRRRSRPTCAASWPATSSSRTTACGISASRRSATTTRASPARPTSSTLEVERG